MRRRPPAEPEVLLAADTIARRVAELGARISADYRDTDDLVLIGVLKGAFVFLADLARTLTIPRSVDFIAVTSYGKGGATQSGLRLVMDVRNSIEGKDVLLVEDILDSGRTLRYLVDTFAARSPKSLRTCVLVRKPSRAVVEVPVDYLGFDIPDRWVVGYGLDYADYYRTLPFIGTIEPPVEP